MSRLRTAASRIASILTSVAILTFAVEEAQGDEIADLRARVEALERLVAQLQGQPESVAASTRSMQRSTDSTPVNRDERFTIRTSDETSARVRGLVHFDARHYADEARMETEDGWVLRRARPILQARLADVAEVGFTPEFAGGRTTILDAFVAMHATPWLSITAGKFKVPIGLERIVPAADLRFIERGLPTSLVPNRDLGLQLHGDIARDRVSYSIGYFNGVSDGGSNDSNGPTFDAGDWAARLFAQPFLRSDDPLLAGLGVGVAATYARDADAIGSALPVYRTPGQQIFFAYRDDAFADDRRVRLAAQFYYHYGPLGLLGEAVQSSQRVQRSNASDGATSIDVRNGAWQLQLSWLLTGEQQKFRGPIEPISPFSIDAGTWGALEVVARYHELDIDDDVFSNSVASLADAASAASEARAFGVGINWYLNHFLKWSMNYDLTRFTGGAPAGADRTSEQFFSGRLAVIF